MRQRPWRNTYERRSSSRWETLPELCPCPRFGGRPFRVRAQADLDVAQQAYRASEQKLREQETHTAQQEFRQRPALSTPAPDTAEKQQGELTARLPAERPIHVGQASFEFGRVINPQGREGGLTRVCGASHPTSPPPRLLLVCKESGLGAAQTDAEANVDSSAPATCEANAGDKVRRPAQQAFASRRRRQFRACAGPKGGIDLFQ